MFQPLKTYFSLFIFILLTTSAKSQLVNSKLTPAPTAKVAYSLLLVGDTGNPANGQMNNLKALQQQLYAADKQSSLIFLGNPFYPQDLPDEGDTKRVEAENKLKSQLDYIKNYAGQLVVVPGDHGKKNKNAKAHRQQELFIETYLQKQKLIQPENGCPGPVQMHINDDLLLLLLDTKWLLPANILPDEGSGCEVTRPSQVFALIDEILRSYPEKQVVLGTHISPTMSGVAYRYLQKSMTQFLGIHPGLILVESNGSAIQHSFSDSLHYVSVGNQYPKIKLSAKKQTLFQTQAPGFAKINFYQNGESWLEFYTSATNANESKVAYRTLLMRKPTQAMLTAKLKKQHFDFTDSVVTVSASEDYNKASKFQRWLMGQNYRQEWDEKVAVPVFDIGKIKGGLKVVEQGGGMQTRSLRLVDAKGKLYTLRSVEKYPANALPKPLRETIAADVLKDQISASHPYAPLVVPTIAEAAKIYHTNPQYFYIPNDPRFGKYLTAFANTIGLFEERPDEDQSDAPFFGNSNNVVGTPKVLENIQEDNDDRVDQKAVVRARLVDFLIGDWDRHEDQWRWATFENKDKNKIYRPIPRDRDMVFFVNQGVIPNIASRKWLMPKVQGFDHEYRDITTFNFNARYFDRMFLTELSLSDWQAAANDLKNTISDAEIEKAIKKLPAPVYKLSGPDIISKIKAHRKDLPRDATNYYKFLAKAVNVVGSDKSELFEVVRQDDENTLVTVRKISKSGDLEQVIYQRQFKTSETEEIRLYGLGGKDEFKIRGEVEKGIKVRVIGGDDTDKITDKSKVAGIFKKTYIYDTATGNELNLGVEARNLTSRKPEVNTYDPRTFKYDYFGPLASVGYNRDDGFLAGGGFSVVKHGFRKEPFAVSHRVLARYAFLTESFRFDYQGYFTQAIGKVDMQLNLDLRTPNYAENYFGLGNETTFNQSIPFNYYRYRSKQYFFSTLFGTKFGKHHSILFGPAYQDINLNTASGNFLADYVRENGNDQSIYQRKTYAGFDFRYTFDSRDQAALPAKGNFIRVGAGAYQGLNNAAANYRQIFGEWSFYHSFRVPLKLVVANRVGGAKNFGDYEIFQANTLEGTTNLRGYRRNRFAGGSSFYNNTDLRLRLFSFQTYLFPGSFGILGFHDVGRVWQKNENSKVWHNSYGGGIWISPGNIFVLSGEYAVSEERNMPILRAAFLF